MPDVDVEASKSFRMYGCSCAPHPDLWSEIRCLRSQLESCQLGLERAQAASEGVEMLIAAAERRGAVKALRNFRDRFDSFDQDEDNAIVMAIADEDADLIEQGMNL